jgi:hypothetical protein
MSAAERARRYRERQRTKLGVERAGRDAVEALNRLWYAVLHADGVSIEQTQALRDRLSAIANEVRDMPRLVRQLAGKRLKP